MILYAGFALMIGLSMAWLFWFLSRPLKNNVFNLENSNVALGKQRQAELAEDLKQNLIDTPEYEQAQREITQTLAMELQQTTELNTPTHNTVPLAVSIFMMVFLAVTSLGVYQLLTPSSKTPVMSQASLQQSAPTLEQSVIELQQFLEKNQDDFKVWRTLGFALLELDDVKGALDAYERSYQLNAKNAPMLVEYASAIATAQNNQFTGRAATLVREALEINPDAPDALYLAGLVAANADRLDLAGKIWKRALSILPQNHPDRSVLEDILAELAQIQGEPMATPQVMIKVALSDRLRQTEFENHYLMIYVKAAQGRPMPIAIQKIRIKDFTGEVVLTDANSVMPTRKLSQSGEVIAVVRLSQSGSAMRQPGDVQALSQILNVQDNPTVHLKIQ